MTVGLAVLRKGQHFMPRGTLKQLTKKLPGTKSSGTKHAQVKQASEEENSRKAQTSFEQEDKKQNRQHFVRGENGQGQLRREQSGGHSEKKHPYRGNLRREELPKAQHEFIAIPKNQKRATFPSVSYPGPQN